MRSAPLSNRLSAGRLSAGGSLGHRQGGARDPQAVAAALHPIRLLECLGDPRQRTLSTATRPVMRHLLVLTEYNLGSRVSSRAPRCAAATSTTPHTPPHVLGQTQIDVRLTRSSKPI